MDGKGQKMKNRSYIGHHVFIIYIKKKGFDPLTHHKPETCCVQWITQMWSEVTTICQFFRKLFDTTILNITTNFTVNVYDIYDFLEQQLNK